MYASGHRIAIAISAITIAFLENHCLSNPMSSESAPRKALAIALNDLRDAANTNLDRTIEILQRLDHIEARLTAGDPVTDIVADEPSPRIVELLTQNMSALETSGAAFRTAQAGVLHHEGLTMDRIADLFGVTRQRISALLR